MSEKQITYKSTLTFHRGLAAEWAEVDPVLKIGEPGFAFDTNEFKIGDGVHKWSELPTYTHIEDPILGVDINGIPLQVINNRVNIPVAADSLLGVVMASQEMNKVNVLEDGTMEINSLGVNKLRNVTGVELCLDCGDANLEE